MKLIQLRMWLAAVAAMWLVSACQPVMAASRNRVRLRPGSEAARIQSRSRRLCRRRCMCAGRHSHLAIRR